jgi:hypothetical protein
MPPCSRFRSTRAVHLRRPDPHHGQRLAGDLTVLVAVTSKNGASSVIDTEIVSCSGSGGVFTGTAERGRRPHGRRRWEHHRDVQRRAAGQRIDRLSGDAQR